MTTKTKVLGILFFVVLVAMFVAGYWPEHYSRIAAEAEARSLQLRVAALDDRVRAAQLHAGLLDLIDAVEAMNYGEAQSLSSSLFDRIRDEAARTEDAQLRSLFRTTLAQRDAVTSALAKGDGAVTAPLKASERAFRQLFGTATVSA
jgi:hypothetical protein